MQHGQLDQLGKALAAAMLELQDPHKAQRGQVRGKRDYRYAGLDDVVASVRPVLARHGLCVLQSIDGPQLVTLLLHASGQYVRACYPIQLSADPQAQGSALTYARRYSLLALLCLAPVEDDDGAAAVQHRQAEPAPMPPPPPPQPSRWTPTEQRRFFAALAAGNLWTDYEALKRFLAWLGKPKPSEMTEDQRAALLAWLPTTAAQAKEAVWEDHEEAEGKALDEAQAREAAP